MKPCNRYWFPAVVNGSSDHEAGPVCWWNRLLAPSVTKLSSQDISSCVFRLIGTKLKASNRNSLNQCHLNYFLLTVTNSANCQTHFTVDNSWAWRHLVLCTTCWSLFVSRYYLCVWCACAEINVVFCEAVSMFDSFEFKQRCHNVRR